MLTTIPLIAIDHAVTRFIPAAYAGTALEVIGALRTGGRYNPPGTPALYTSIKRSTALAEATQTFADEDPIAPMLMLSVSVDSRSIADLTDTDTIRLCGSSVGELTAPLIDTSVGTAPTQILGLAAHATARIHGLLVWSRIAKTEKNLVLFPDLLGMRYGLNDPDHDLPTIHPAVKAAIDVLMGGTG